ncbi:hypothetical protein ACN4EE_01700 [Geminocystis sp. CENA526]|uniref:hypothetical protein n=1 Tax=Geminocystis sp. CENA526 TaxID=1355871 RepID=UPI003D6E7B01
MQSALHLKTQVLPSGKIEIESPDLEIGDIVDVFIISPQKSSVKQNSIEDIIKDLPGQEIFKTAQEVDEYLKGERDISTNKETQQSSVLNSINKMRSHRNSFKTLNEINQQIKEEKE